MLIHEGQYVAEVEVSLIETDEGWKVVQFHMSTLQSGMGASNRP